MATEYADQFIIIADVYNPNPVAGAARLASVNNSAKNYDPDVGGEFTFPEAFLSADGNAPFTHTACFTRANSAMKTGILGMASGHVPFVDVYDTGEGWTLETALADMGLQRGAS